MAARVEKLNALLKRVQERRAQPRLQAVAAPLPPAAASVLPVEPPPPPVRAQVAPAVTVPSPSPASMRPESVQPGAEGARRAPTSSPLEDAMAQLGTNREDSGPLQVEPLAPPIHMRERPSAPEPRVNQDLMVTHRPEAGSLPTGPIVELVQPKPHGQREPTLQFDTGVKVNPRAERELKPPAEPPAEVLTGPTHKLEPAPIAQTTPVRVTSSARREAPRNFGELLELSLALRPASR